MGLERVQKLIASSGHCSRRKAEQLIIQKRVLINGKIAKIGDKATPTQDLIIIDGEPIKLSRSNRVLLLNKPKGVISSCKDNLGRKTILDLIPEELKNGLHPIGRLDLESRGAILLTNNGELTLKLSHPRFQHSKTYKVLLKGILEKNTIQKWRNGIYLDGKLTIKVSIDVLKRMDTETLINITMREGRNRQIRRIAELIGHPVIDLQRTAIANIKLNKLKEGYWRILKNHEWRNLLLIEKNEFH